MQLLHYNGIKPFYNCDVMKNDGTARHAMMLPTHPTAGRRRYPADAVQRDGETPSLHSTAEDTSN